MNERYSYSNCHWTRFVYLWGFSSLSRNGIITIYQKEMFGPRPAKACSLFPLLDLGRQEEAQRLQPAPRRRHVRRSGAATSLSDFAGQPAMLSRHRSPAPLPLRAASASHLALALSAVFVPFTQPQGLLQQRQLSGRRHLPVWAAGRGGTRAARISSIGGEGRPAHKTLRLLAEPGHGRRGLRSGGGARGKRKSVLWDRWKDG